VRELLKDKHNKASLMLAIGLILIVAHYQGQPLLQYLFLPQIGMAVLLGTVLILIASEWKSLTLGPKMVWIPLAVIAGSAVLRLLIQQDMATLAGAMFMSSMFGLYVISRQYGERALSFFVPVVIIGAVSIIVQAAISGQGRNPGIFSEYATAAEFLVFGLVVAPRKWQWWLSGIVMAGLFFTGAPEALFYAAIGGVVVLVRRDWSRRLLVPVGAILGLLLICSPLGITQTIWGRSFSMLKQTYSAVTDADLTEQDRDELLNEATNGRWLNGWRLHRAVQPLGYGVNPTYHYKLIPHNIILLVIDQLGPVAMVAWVAVIIAGIKKTKWKYGFLALALFGVFQPFVWTKMAPWLWAMAGAATTSSASSYVFRMEAI